MSTMAFDFCFVPNGPVSEVVTLAHLGDELGYRCMWIPDQGSCRDPFVIATAVTATKRIDVGIGITTPLTRHPLHLARVAATLDEVSGHRLRLGLGSGNLAHVVRPMGMPADRTVERVRQGLHDVRALLAGAAVRFADEPEEPVRLEFTPDRVMPLYVGARGPRMLALAGEVADGVLIESLFNGEAMPHALGRLDEGADRAGRSSADLDKVSWQVVVVSDNPAEDVEQYREWTARMVQAGPKAAVLRAGIAESVYEDVRRAMGDGRVSDAVQAVTDDAVRCLMMIGTAEELADRIRQLSELGCTAVTVLSTRPLGVTARNLIRFAETVIPLVRPPQEGRRPQPSHALGKA